MIAHVCHHRLCSSCWFAINDDGKEDNNEILHRNFCGGRVCIVLQPVGQVKEVEGVVNNTVSATVARPYRQGVSLWRRNVEGIRLIEAMLHESTRKLVSRMLRVQDAYQLDSGETSKLVALEAIVEPFNDLSWTVPKRFPDDSILSDTFKIDPNCHPKVVDRTLIQKKMQDLMIVDLGLISHS